MYTYMRVCVCVYTVMCGRFQALSFSPLCRASSILTCTCQFYVKTFLI